MAGSGFEYRVVDPHEMSHLLGDGAVSNAKQLPTFRRSPLPCNFELLTNWNSFISDTISIFTNATTSNLHLTISLDSPNEAVSFFNFVHLFEFPLHENHHRNFYLNMLINYDKQMYLWKILFMSSEFRIELTSSNINIQIMRPFLMDLYTVRLRFRLLAPSVNSETGELNTRQMYNLHTNTANNRHPSKPESLIRQWILYPLK